MTTEKFYFTKVTQDYWTSKNNLQRDAKKLMRSFERRIIKESEKKEFIKDIDYAFNFLNSRYSRCKPLLLNHRTPEKDTVISISGVTELKLYKGVNEVNVE